MGAVTKARKQFILDQQKINRVKHIVRAKTDTEAISLALDIIIDNSRIESVLQAIRGKGRIKDVYGRSSA